MPKTILLLILCCLSLSSSALAQEKNAAPQADSVKTYRVVGPSLDPLKFYESWKKVKLGERAETTKHHALVVVAQRTGDNTAQLDIAAVGEMANGFMLEVQPVALASGGKQVGTPTTTSVTTGDPKDDLASPATTKLILPVTVDADGLQIKWLFSERVKNERGEDSLAPHVMTLEIRLTDEPKSSAIATVKEAGKGAGK